MGTMERYLIAYLGYTWARRRAVLDESGYTTEAIVITATLALLAIAVAALITTKVLAKANSINLDGGS